MQSKPLASETSDSPPSYEKSNFHESIEYPDSQASESLVNSVTDVDHRVVPVPRPNDVHLPRLMKSGDVDHRNLISLTGSPASVINSESVTSNNRIWDSDQDYRYINYIFLKYIYQLKIINNCIYNFLEDKCSRVI